MDGQIMFQREQQGKLFRPEISELVMQDGRWGDIPGCLTNPDLHWLSAIQYLDIKNYLPLDIMTKVDRMSMAHSIEAREPLLDHKLVEFSATIPPELKLRNGRTKDIFKRSLQGILPDEVINRRKQGFAVPLGRWFRGQLTEFVHDLLLSETSRTRGIFNLNYIERILAVHKGGRDLDLHIWTLISFELWCRMFLDSTRHRTIDSVAKRAPVLAYSNSVARG
jgi:asparagine synthase (glutamine-hydrolysing)